MNHALYILNEIVTFRTLTQTIWLSLDRLYCRDPLYIMWDCHLLCYANVLLYKQGLSLLVRVRATCVCPEATGWGKNLSPGGYIKRDPCWSSVQAWWWDFMQLYCMGQYNWVNIKRWWKKIVIITVHLLIYTFTEKT